MSELPCQRNGRAKRGFSFRRLKSGFQRSRKRAIFALMRTLKDLVIDTPDFPKPGVIFRDISPILGSPAHFRAACEAMVEHVALGDIDLVVGVESRGFILGAAIAAMHAKGFVPLRKAGKLPPPVEAQAYALEYGEACLEIKRGEGRVLVVDDVLATGGTLAAAIELCQRAGYRVQDVSVLINLRFLNNMTWNGRVVPAPIVY